MIIGCKESFDEFMGMLEVLKVEKPVILSDPCGKAGFEVGTGDNGIPRPLTDNVIHELSQSDKYEIIDHSNMNKILKERKRYLSL